MTNDIKEIIERINTASEEFDCLLKPKECTKLFEYITNLREEMELLRKYYIGEKLKNDNAIGYVKISMNNPQPFYKYLYGDINGRVENLDNLLNILQGSDKE